MVGVIQNMNEFFKIIGAGLLAYLIGSLPVGYLVAKARGIDITDVGSGNIGATNIGRALGWKLGAVVGVLDFTKGFLPAIFIQRSFVEDWQVLLLAVIPVVAHIFPVWLNFKGGKGVATIFGILGAFFGLPAFLIFLAIWLLAVRVVKLMSLINLIVGVLLPLAFWLKFANPLYTLFGLLLGMIIWWTHRENIKRLLAGKENRLHY